MAKKNANYADMAKEALDWMVRESRTASDDRVRGPEEAAKVAALALAATGEFHREHFGLICLNARGAVLDARVISSGTVDQAPAYPREIARAALLASSTVSVLIFHNHPGGNVAPSEADRALTRAVRQALELFGICLHDHLVFAGHRYYSIAAEREGVFAEAAQPTLF